MTRAIYLPRTKEASPAKKLSAAEIDALTPAERNARKRQQSLSERTAQVLSNAQVEAIHFALCTFFFIYATSLSVPLSTGLSLLSSRRCPLRTRGK